MPQILDAQLRRDQHADGCTSLEGIVESQGHVVNSMARRIKASIPDFACIELKDLIQAGNVGVVNAVQSYSATTGVPFDLYARFRIRGEMLDTLRRLDAVRDRGRVRALPAFPHCAHGHRQGIGHG